MSRLAEAILVLLPVWLACTSPAPAAGNMRSEDRYDPQHIGNLPPESRARVLKQCPEARALHEFASYSDQLRRVVLHFEHLYCGAKPFCSPSGCFHQTYVESGGHYRLIRSYTGPAGQ